MKHILVNRGKGEERVRFHHILLALDGFQKKTQQTPQSHIKLAEQRLADWQWSGKAFTCSSIKDQVGLNPQLYSSNQIFVKNAMFFNPQLYFARKISFYT
jgi:hypothetical protein